MKLIISTTFVLLLSFSQNSFVYSQSNKSNYTKTSKLICRLKPDSRFAEALNNLDWDGKTRNEIMASLGISVEKIEGLRLDSQKGAISGNIIERIHILTLKENQDMTAAINTLKKTDEFDYVESDANISTGSKKSETIFDESGKVRFDSAIIPNDRLFHEQWGLYNTGQIINNFNGKVGADINLIRAWDFTRGDSNLIISIIDSGIPVYTFSSPEFSQRILTGYDFVNNDTVPEDEFGHGSNILSIIAAKGNNYLGIAGINWHSRILPVKVINKDDNGFVSDYIKAIVFASDRGARIINMSLGTVDNVKAFGDAVDYAYSKGAVIIAAMGNSNEEFPALYPADYSNTIAVGATNNTDNRAQPFCWGAWTGSNIGSHLDFVAPGEMIIGLNNKDTLGSYWCGTSQAAAIASGVVSLMFSINPNMKFEDVYNILRATSRDQVGSKAEDTPGWDKYFGWGRIDAFEAVKKTKELLSVNLYSQPAELDAINVFPNPAIDEINISFNTNGHDNIFMIICDEKGRNVLKKKITGVTPGKNVVSLDVSYLARGIYAIVIQSISDSRISSGNFIVY